MKNNNRRDLSVVRCGMACAMSSVVVSASAVRFDNALRFSFFGFSFAKRPVCERSVL